MFLCRSRFAVASSYSYTKSAALGHFGTQDATRALHMSRIISCSRVPARGASRVLHLISGARPSARSNTWEPLTRAFPACESRSGLGFVLPCLRARKHHHNLNNRLISPKSLFWVRTEPCSLHSSTMKPPQSAVFSAKELEHACGTKRDADDHKVMQSNRPQGECEKPDPQEKPNKTAKLKKVFKEYGAVAVLFHIGISLISLGIFYIVVSSGISMTDVLYKLGFSESVVQSKMAAGTSTFVLAYAVHKLFAPFRISITLVSVPLIVRYLRKTGLFKASPPRM